MTKMTLTTIYKTRSEVEHTLQYFTHLPLVALTVALKVLLLNTESDAL
jgi:hypothetical protein